MSLVSRVETRPSRVETRLTDPRCMAPRRGQYPVLASGSTSARTGYRLTSSSPPAQTLPILLLVIWTLLGRWPEGSILVQDWSDADRTSPGLTPDLGLWPRSWSTSVGRELVLASSRPLVSTRPVTSIGEPGGYPWLAVRGYTKTSHRRVEV